MKSPGRSRNNESIWEAVRNIPQGSVATYGEIARLCGLIGGARVVGYALRMLPLKSDVPWHRVINSQGRISLPRTSGAYSTQKRLLEREGVVFQNGRIDLEKYGWVKSLDNLERASQKRATTSQRPVSHRNFPE